MICFKSLRHALLMGVAAFGGAAAVSAIASPAYAQEITRTYNIQPQDLNSALREFAIQTGRDVLHPPQLVAGKRSSGAQGQLTERQALQAILANTGLQFEQTESGGYAIQDGGSGLGAGNREESSQEEIVVTATRREERLEDVPLSIQAISGDELNRSGALNFADYGRTVAGVSLIDEGPGRSQIFIRGVSSGGDVDIGKDSVVGTYIDEMPVSESSAQPDLRLYDINHVEILRGPQGTLYGSGSLGGTVRVLTNQPDFDEVAGYAHVVGSVTNYGGANTSADGWLNIPLSDNAAVRAVAYTLHNSGFIDNGLNGQEDMGDEDTYGGRLAFRIEPTESLDVTLTGYYQNTRGDLFQRTTDHYPGLVYDQNQPEPFSDEMRAANLNVNLDLGFATLTSSSSYFDRSRFMRNDFDFAIGFPISSQLFYDATTVAQEVRLASNGEDRFRWLVGVFYLDRKDDFHQPIDFAGVPPPPVLYRGTTNIDTKQTAAFAEVNFDILENLTATAGVRVTEVSRDMSAFRTGLLVGGVEFEDSNSGDERSTTPKVNLSYRPSDDSLIYVQAVQGFRVGGINTLPPCAPCTQIPNSFNSDTLWNYEVGGRVALFDDALSLSGAIFRIDWEDIQLNINREDLFNGIVNLGEARSQGVEFEFHGEATENLSYGGQVTYTDTTILSVDPTYAGVASPGTEVPQVPRWSAALNAEWGVMLEGSTRFYVRGDIQYVGERRSGLGATSLIVDSFTLVNARVGWDVGPLSVAFFAMNATDERAQTSHSFINSALPSGPPSFDRYGINTPRTIGVSIARSF